MELLQTRPSVYLLVGHRLDNCLRKQVTNSVRRRLELLAKISTLDVSYKNHVYKHNEAQNSKSKHISEPHYFI